MAEENHLGSALEEKERSPEAGRARDGVSRRVLLRQHPRTRLRTALLILIPLFVVAGSILLWRYFASYESTDDAQVDVHLYPVSARVSGYVVKVNVTDNQYVQQGAVLVEIDPRDYQVAVDKARADLANAEATARSELLGSYHFGEHLKPADIFGLRCGERQCGHYRR